MFKNLTRLRSALVAVIVTLSGAVACASPVIGSFDFSRGGEDSLAEGDYLSGFRNAILSSFPGSVITGSSTLTPEYLSTVNAVVIGSPMNNVDATSPLSSEEQTALLDYVKAGGSALILVDNELFGGAGTVAANDSFLAPFGLHVSGYYWPELNNTVTNTTNLITNGPFGLAGSYVSLCPGNFDNLGTAVALATLDVTGNAGLAYFPRGALSPTSGLVVFASDINAFNSAAPHTPEYFPDYFSMPGNHAIAMNTIAAMIPEPSAMVLLGVGAMGVLGYARWRRKGAA
jgi:hypothetical protein